MLQGQVRVVDGVDDLVLAVRASFGADNLLLPAPSQHNAREPPLLGATTYAADECHQERQNTARNLTATL